MDNKTFNHFIFLKTFRFDSAYFEVQLFSELYYTIKTEDSALHKCLYWCFIHRQPTLEKEESGHRTQLQGRCRTFPYMARYEAGISWTWTRSNLVLNRLLGHCPVNFLGHNYALFLCVGQFIDAYMHVWMFTQVLTIVFLTRWEHIETYIGVSVPQQLV